METFIKNIKQIGTQLKELWGRMTLNQKVFTGAAALLSIITLTVIVGVTGRTQYEALYSELDEKDASAIVEVLKEEKIDYRLADNGSTILVPSEYKYTTRLKLAGENLPRGEAGFELFRESSFGETQTDKKIKYREALQGELARTIQRLDKVKAAKVNLALPEQSLFSEKDEPPKASVILNTKTGETLNGQEVQAIANLVANSVERLEIDNVVIVDQFGNLLSDSIPLEESMGAGNMQMQMALKREYEKQKQNAIQSMLDKTLGKENSVVRVNVELDFDNKEEVAEKYWHDPGGPFIRSEEISKESSTTGQNAGVPGVDSNIPRYEEVNQSQGSFESSIKKTNFEIDRTETVTRYAPGSVKYDYFTVSVLVNKASTKGTGMGETDEEKIETIRKIVATACGLRENRGDENVRLDENISVAFIDFYTEPVPEPTPLGFTDYIFRSTLAPWLLAGAALLIILLIWAATRGRRRAAETTTGFDTLVGEDITMESLFDKTLTPEEKETQRVKQEINELIDKNPEDAAQVLRTWLAED